MNERGQLAPVYASKIGILHNHMKYGVRLTHCVSLLQYELTAGKLSYCVQYDVFL